MSEKKIKHSVLVGALTSSFGIFISKALGLIYYSPLSALAGESNMSFYSITYTYYDLLLKISSAGIPFAIAALVARYYAKEDYKTVLLIKKLGISLIMGLSFIVALGFLFMINPLAKQSMGQGASANDIFNLKVLFYILLIAIIFVPFLSAVRGYYQGLKRLDLYGSSQVLEQFVRVGSILLFGYILVILLKLDSIFAIYTAIAAAGLAAIVALLFMFKMTKEDDKHIDELIKNQESEEVSKKIIIKEILSLGLPYVLMSVLGSISPLVNTTYFLDYTASIGMPIEQSKLSLGILQANCNKLSSIPQVLTLGFSAGLVPYITESLEKQDFNKLSRQVKQLLDTVLFILIPVLMIFFFFAKEIYYIMYGNLNLELGTKLFRTSNILTFTDTIAPILSSIMITLRKRKTTLIILGLSCLVKLGLFFPFVLNFGASGMVYSSLACSSFVIALYLLALYRSFSIGFSSELKKAIAIAAISFFSVLIPYLLRQLIPFNYNSRIICILLMIPVGIIFLFIYYLLSKKAHLPQDIFGIEDFNIKDLLKRFRM